MRLQSLSQTLNVVASTDSSSRLFPVILFVVIVVSDLFFFLKNHVDSLLSEPG